MTIGPSDPWPIGTKTTTIRPTHAHQTTIADYRTTTHDHRTIKPLPMTIGPQSTTQNQNHDHRTHDPWPSNHNPWQPTIVGPQPSIAHNRRTITICRPQSSNHRREKRKERSERGNSGKRRQIEKKRRWGWIKTSFFFLQSRGVFLWFKVLKMLKNSI